MLHIKTSPVALASAHLHRQPATHGCPMLSPIPRFLSAAGIILQGSYKPTDNRGPQLVIQNVSKYNRDIDMDMDIDIDKYIHTCITLHYITLHYIT